jgi:hypothetical protein
MGQLTFQATLGGAVNLAGPNTTSTTTFTLPAADGTNGQALTTNGSGTLAFATISGTPSGSTTQLQYNNAGAFAGSANMTFDGTSLTLPNDAFIGGYRVGAGVGGNNTVFTPNGSSTIITGTSYQNVAFGVYALSSQTATGYTNNTALGWAALRYNTSGVNNVATGFSALTANTSASNCSAFGGYSLSANLTGANNTAVGFQALTSNTAGNYLTAVGWRAGYSQNASGDSYSTFVGYSAGSQITTGVANVCVGFQTGQVVTTGIRNVYIGFNNNASATNADDEILISTTAGTTGKGGSTGFISPGGGGVYQGNNAATWSVTSDLRLKKNIVDNNIGLDKITAIQVRNFEYRLPEEVDAQLKPTDAVIRSGVQLGVIAQELQVILPECVKTESTGVMTVDQDNLTWYLINAVKQLKAEIDQLKGNV